MAHIERWLGDDRMSWDNSKALLVKAMNNKRNLVFDGIDDYVEVAHNSLLNITDFLTLEFWVRKADELPQDYGTSYRTIISKGPAVATYSVNWRSDMGRNKFNFDITVGGTRYNAPNFDVPDGWHHVACVYDGSQLIAYVDGEKTVINDGISGAISTNTNSLYFGYSGGDRIFPGQIKDVRLWNVARTQQEIKDNMNNLLLGTETGLVAYYPLNEEFGTEAHDRSANALDGTILGATWE